MLPKICTKYLELNTDFMIHYRKQCGELEYYDKSYDRITTKLEKRLARVNRLFHKVTTTDDPIIRKVSKTDTIHSVSDAHGNKIGRKCAGFIFLCLFYFHVIPVCIF